MSGKETVIDWVQQLPEGFGVEEILTALRHRLNHEVVRSASASDDYAWPADDLTEDEWRHLVAHAWRSELEDRREDVYSLDDGAPAHEQG